MRDAAMDQTITVNGEARPWASQDLRALLVEAGIDPARGGVAVAVNGEVVPRARWDHTRLAPDDRIEIVHIVRGG